MIKDHKKIIDKEGIVVQPSAIINITNFCNNPSAYLYQIQTLDDRILLTKNGKPMAGVIPLWMLAVLEKTLKETVQIVAGESSCKKHQSTLQTKYPEDEPQHIGEFEVDDVK